MWHSRKLLISAQLKNRAAHGQTFPIGLTPKQNRTARLCADFRELNSITVRDSYPLASFESIIHYFGRASVFTTLD